MQRKLQEVGGLGDAKRIAELEAEIQRLRLVLSGAGAGSWDWNLLDNSVTFDERWSTMLGLDPAQTPQVLSTWESRVHPDDLPSCYRDIRAHIEGRTSRYENIHRVRHADGHWVWILDRGKITRRDSNGKAVRFSGVHVDITLQKNAEELLRETQQELERQRAFNIHASRMATVGEMAGGIAHEINSPLAVIATLAGQIEEYADTPSWSPGQTRAAASRILQTSQRIRQIISTVLGIARQAPTDPKVLVPLQKIIEDAYSLCRERFLLSGIHVSIEIKPQTLKILGRPNEITQIILNLLQNARDAVLAKQLKNHDRWIKVQSSALDKKIQIRVLDNGGPISADVRRRLFEPFFTTKPPQQGTGLGLPISRKIIEGHDGRIWLDETSADTCFVIELPNPEQEISGAKP
ncbi:MAG: sensor histidine kinase [Oligoflexia bacterium]